ncbi:hypothetical protein Q4579_09850 [Photobacterium sp. 1_MG-2023]|nr:hypothetical protein [Photobacterium sp. 1_MG-2023]
MLALCAVGLFMFYLIFQEDDVIYADVMLASIVMVIYAGVHHVFHPEIIKQIHRAGVLLYLAPLASYGAILFPGLQTKYSETTTIILGWIGLVLSSFCLMLLILMMV